MQRNVLYAVIAVLLIVIAVGGYAWYDHRKNTLLEVELDHRGISIQKN